MTCPTPAYQEIKSRCRAIVWSAATTGSALEMADFGLKMPFFGLFGPGFGPLLPILKCRRQNP